MKNQIVYILPGIFLLINAWYDIRKRKILLHSIWIFTVLWILFLMFVDKEKIWQAFGGILPGMFLLTSAYATRQAIGYGDGLAFLFMWQGFKRKISKKVNGRNHRYRMILMRRWEPVFCSREKILR